MRSVWTCSSQSIHRWVLYNQSGVFTARYAMSPCTKRSSFLFKRLHSTACYMFRSRQNRPQAIHTKHLNHSSSSCSANTVTRRDGVAQKEPQVGVYLYLTFPRSLPCQIQRCQRCAGFSNRPEFFGGFFLSKTFCRSS